MAIASEYACGRCNGPIVNHPTCSVKEIHCSRCCPVIAANRKRDLHVSLKELRAMKPNDFFDLETIKFVCDKHRTLAVLVPYETYKKMNHRQ
jgi:hypothetical protein